MVPEAKYAFELDLHAARELLGIDFVFIPTHNATRRLRVEVLKV